MGQNQPPPRILNTLVLGPAVVHLLGHGVHHTGPEVEVMRGVVIEGVLTGEARYLVGRVADDFSKLR